MPIVREWFEPTEVRCDGCGETATCGVAVTDYSPEEPWSAMLVLPLGWSVGRKDWGVVYACCAACRGEIEFRP